MVWGLTPHEIHSLVGCSSAVANVDDLETHLNNAEGAHADARGEISSAKSSANNLDDDLKAVKAALDPRSDRDRI